MTEEEIKDRLLSNFTLYLDYVYQYINLPAPTPLQQRLSKILGENPERLILEAARGVGKSWIAAIYATYRLARNKEEKVLIVSASSPKADEIGIFIRRLFDVVPLLKGLNPANSKDSRDSTRSFDVAGCNIAIAPSVATVGITGQITGKRATLIIGDDVEIPSNSMTELMREKLSNRVNEFEALLSPDIPGSIILLGTPQSMESIYSKLPYDTIILPAQVPEDESIYEGKLDPWILKQGAPGEPTDKVRFPMEELNKKLAGMGPSTYKLQFMLDTTLSDAERYPLKLKDLIVHPLDKFEGPKSISYAGSKDYILNDLMSVGFTGDTYHKPLRTHPEYANYEFKVMAIDPSGSGTDETTYAIVGVLNGYIYLLDSGGTNKGFSDEALFWLANKAKEYKVNIVVPERNWGGGMFYNLLSKVLADVYPCTIEDEFTSKGQKELRIINNVAPLTTNHKLVIDYGLVERDMDMAARDPSKLPYSLLYQYTHLTKDRDSLTHDDRLDSLAIACEYVKDMVMVDASEAIAHQKEVELEKWLNARIYGNEVYKNSSSNNYLKSY